MNRWMRVAMLLCGVVISVSAAHAVQQGDDKAMLERLAAKTKAEVSRLEHAEKKFSKKAGRIPQADNRTDKQSQRRLEKKQLLRAQQQLAVKSELLPEQLAGRNIKPTRAAALGMGRMTGQEGSCSDGTRTAEQDAGRIKEIRRELRQKKQLLQKTEIKLARQNQSAVSSKKEMLRQKHQQSGQRVQSSQMVAAAEGETGSISGKVTDAAGSPVADVYVYVYTSDYSQSSIK